MSLSSELSVSRLLASAYAAEAGREEISQSYTHQEWRITTFLDKRKVSMRMQSFGDCGRLESRDDGNRLRGPHRKCHKARDVT